MKGKGWKFGLGVWVGVFLMAAGLRAQTKAPAKEPAGKGSAAAKAEPAFPATLLKPAGLTAQAPETYFVKFETTKGEFVVKVTRAWAPLGADRFYNLVRNKFYDGAHFFRVLPGFVAQFGISAHPEVSTVWREARIKDDPVRQSNTRGLVTFATSGADSRTTQVFINLGGNGRLDGMGFSPFGEVTQGMEVVDQFFSGYGEGVPRGNGPDQSKIQAQGKAYLDKDFDKLDSIKTARILTSAMPGQSAKQPAKQP